MTRASARRGRLAAPAGPPARAVRLRAAVPVPVRGPRPDRDLDAEPVVEPELRRELRDLARLVVEHERDADAAGAGTRRPADPVDVVLPRGRRVVVDDVRDAADVD